MRSPIPLLVAALMACSDAGDDESTPVADPPPRRPVAQAPADEQPPATDEEPPPVEEEEPPPVEEEEPPPVEEEEPPPVEEEEPPPVEEAPCPDGVTCIDALPYYGRANTVGGASRFDAYGCAPGTDESGPERVYRLEVAHEGFLAIDLGDMPEGVDVDVHLLRELDPDACVDRGHWRAAGWVTPGTWWIVADTWVTGDGRELPGAFSLSAEGMDPEVGQAALRAFALAWEQGDTGRLEYGITDFSMHSSAPRQWIVDLVAGEVLWNLHTNHGEASADVGDPGLAVAFSNVPGSHQSSLGMYRSAETYTGDYGYSFRFDGLEPGYNDAVRERAIVMHPWVGSRPETIDETGYLPHSWGCPAIDDRISAPVVDLMHGGALYFFWYPDGDWSERSRYLRR